MDARRESVVTVKCRGTHTGAGNVRLVQGQKKGIHTNTRILELNCENFATQNGASHPFILKSI